MSVTHAMPGHDGPFVPLRGLPQWSQHMAQAVDEHRRGHVMAAMALYHQSLAVARSGLQGASGAPAPAAAECLQALLVSSDGLAALAEESGGASFGARIRADLHTELLDHIRRSPPGSPWRQAAVACAQASHEGLLAHWQEHGWDGAIEAALRAGCMRLVAAGAWPH